MDRAESVCPHCGNESTPWIFHAGVWWVKCRESNERQWVDEDAQIWRFYKDGTPSDPAVTDKTPNLRIDPAIVKPPPERQAVDTSTAVSSRDSSASFASELERLAELHALGALNDEQFEAAKARLLNL